MCYYPILIIYCDCGKWIENPSSQIVVDTINEITNINKGTLEQEITNEIVKSEGLFLRKTEY